MSKRNQQSVRVPFRIITSAVLASGQASTQITPANMSSRLSSIGDNFDLYRLNRFRFRIHPYTLTTELLVVSHYPNTVDTTPSFASVSEANSMAIQGGQATVPSDWINVPLTECRGALPWYKTVAGSPDSWEEVCGTFAFASNSGTSTSNIFIEVEGEMEFSGAADPAITPQERLSQNIKKEKERIMKVLAYKDPKDTSTPTKRS